MKTLQVFRLTLHVRGPILVQSTSPSTFGVDAAAARIVDPRNPSQPGLPCIPGTLLKGKLRQALEDVGESSQDLFGSEPVDGLEPNRGSLIIGDLAATETGKQDARQHRIAIDEQLGSAKAEMLRVIETPFEAGETVSFTGLSYAYLDHHDARDAENKIRLGLCLVNQVGSLRTTGFGRVVDHDVSIETRGRLPLPSIVRPPVAIDVALRPEGAMCFARHKIGDNLFESDEIIPGAALAGAVLTTAEALGIRKEFEEIDKVRFRHAFPTTGQYRPRAVPLSTVKAGSVIYDIGDFGEPVLLSDESGNFRAPAFSVDWKDSSDVRRALGWQSPFREVRLRTKIDRDSRRADRGGGDGGKLFAWEMIHPFTDKGNPLIWRSRVDLSGVSDPRRVASALLLVFSQLGFVSKTKALCVGDCTLLKDAEEVAPQSLEDTLTLVLQTPALIADPRFGNGRQHSGAVSAEEMTGLYRQTFAELSRGALTLRHHFAQQRLMGGDYMARRFGNSSPYDPWLLTTEGSVFVFDVVSKEMAAQCVNGWLMRGLPLPAWARKRYENQLNGNIDPYSTDFRRSPFRPENGFGEIAIHSPTFAAPKVRPVRKAAASA